MRKLSLFDGRLPALWILLVGMLAHGLCLGADYFLDDGLMLAPDYLAWDGEWREWKYRVVPAFLSVVTFHLFGDSPMAQHFWNLAIHLSLSLVVFWGARVFLESGKLFKDREQLRRAAFFAALIFACHPIGSEAVNYARCTRIQCVALFSMLAAIGTLRFCQLPSWRSGLGIIAVVVLATFSKDPGFLHAVGNVMIVSAVYANWGKLTRWLKRPLDWAVALLAVGAFFWIGLHGYTSWWVRRAKSAFFNSGLDFGEHALTQGRVFFGYLQRIVFPANLSSDHYIPMTRSLADTPAVLMTLGVILLTGATAWMMFRRRTRLFGVLGMLALAPLLLRFLYPISEFMVEYRIYPALPWIAVLGGAGLAMLYHKYQPVMKHVVTLLIIAGVMGSAMRSAIWQDAGTLAQNVLDQYPNNNRARNELQRLSREQGYHVAVLAMRKDVIKAVNAVGEYNDREEETGRKYLVEWANEWFIRAEARVALTLAESVSSEAGIKHIDNVMAQVSAHYPQYFDPHHRTFKYGEPLVELRDMIVRFGAIQDRRRVEQAAAGLLDEP